MSNSVYFMALKWCSNLYDSNFTMEFCHKGDIQIENCYPGFPLSRTFTSVNGRAYYLLYLHKIKWR